VFKRPTLQEDGHGRSVTGVWQGAVSRISKRNQDDGDRNRKNKFGDNWRTAQNMAVVPNTEVW